MGGSAPDNRSTTHGTHDSRWITATVALFATAVFALSASEILPDVLFSTGRAGGVRDDQISALLLNIALLLFAWRRSNQLRESFAERDAAELRARKLVYVDEVTGLYNRRYMREAFAKHFARKGSKSMLLLIDLDHFKKVNDLYGHEKGDALLITVAGCLRDVCPPDGLCIRLGGDEFAVLLLAPEHDKYSAQMLARKIIRRLKEPFRMANAEVQIGASIGLCESTNDDPDLGALLRRADIAMYEAKRLGGDRCVAFDITMQTELDHRTVLEGEIRNGIERGEFVPYFQPIIDLDTHETRGFEVLARWQHPTRGLLEPPEFFEIAQTGGLIGELSLNVMHQALAIAAKWPGRFRIAVNVSPPQFKDPLLAQRIFKLLALTGFPGRRLDLEIAESTLIADRAFALAIIQSLKNSGIGIVVDDFGTGYAALTQLQALPFDRLKIDRSFIASLSEGGDSDALVQAIALLGKGLSIPIAAEGVESHAIQSRLIELGCDDAQGWLFAKALSAEEVVSAYAGGFGSEAAAKQANA